MSLRQMSRVIAYLRNKKISLEACEWENQSVENGIGGESCKPKARAASPAVADMKMKVLRKEVMWSRTSLQRPVHEKSPELDRRPKQTYHCKLTRGKLPKTTKVSIKWTAKRGMQGRQFVFESCGRGKSPIPGSALLDPNRRSRAKCKAYTVGLVLQIMGGLF